MTLNDIKFDPIWSHLYGVLLLTSHPHPVLQNLNVALVLHSSLSHFDTFQLIITTNLEEVGDKKEHQLPLVLRKRWLLFICQVTEFIVATWTVITCDTFHLFGERHIKEIF